MRRAGVQAGRRACIMCVAPRQGGRLTAEMQRSACAPQMRRCLAAATPRIVMASVSGCRAVCIREPCVCNAQWSNSLLCCATLLGATASTAFPSAALLLVSYSLLAGLCQLLISGLVARLTTQTSSFLLSCFFTSTYFPTTYLVYLSCNFNSSAACDGLPVAVRLESPLFQHKQFLPHLAPTPPCTAAAGSRAERCQWGAPACLSGVPRPCLPRPVQEGQQLGRQHRYAKPAQGVTDSVQRH